MNVLDREHHRVDAARIRELEEQLLAARRRVRELESWQTEALAAMRRWDAEVNDTICELVDEGVVRAVVR